MNNSVRDTWLVAHSTTFHSDNGDDVAWHGLTRHWKCWGAILIHDCYTAYHYSWRLVRAGSRAFAPISTASLMCSIGFRSGDLRARQESSCPSSVHQTNQPQFRGDGLVHCLDVRTGLLQGAEGKQMGRHDPPAGSFIICC